ncbi:unnamed protein product [Protopolystoma xenopodis]|uniref:Uncharacterized protein n=1 Tax=Protopolystoma xenopodis TaxID=117903 RepID=A0A448X2U9_9PLAT|nr:unnamed protein product [Protopolystoma xenopodis]
MAIQPRPLEHSICFDLALQRFMPPLHGSITPLTCLYGSCFCECTLDCHPSNMFHRRPVMELGPSTCHRRVF